MFITVLRSGFSLCVKCDSSFVFFCLWVGWGERERERERERGGRGSGKHSLSAFL
jgi:hypothetical protein